MRVELSWTELRLAVLMGGDRNIRTINDGRHRGGGQPEEDGWTDHITGAIAELAVAKAFNLYPSLGAKPDTVEGDAGRFQVRSTTRLSGSLILQTYDGDDECFVLVVGRPPCLDIVGWIRGGDGKRPEWWRTDVRYPAYFVPQAALRPLDALVETR